MTAERSHVLKLKGDQFKEDSDQSNDDSPKVALKKMVQMRVKTNLSRVNAFKFACEKSVWYYSLIKRLIKEDIQEKPLVRFITGKFCF